MKSTETGQLPCAPCLFPLAGKLCIAEHPHFPTDSGIRKLVTQGYFAHFYSDSKCSVTCFSSEVEMRYRVCFSCSQLAPLTNGCLSISLLLHLFFKHLTMKEDHMQVLKGKILCWGFKAIWDQTKPVLTVAKEEKNSPTAKSSCQNK